MTLQDSLFFFFLIRVFFQVVKACGRNSLAKYKDQLWGTALQELLYCGARNKYPLEKLVVKYQPEY